MRILLVEDDEVIIGVLEKALTRQHYSVDTATNGQMGWELVATYRYDLIILDIGLPKLNGIEFCQRLRAHHYLVPVLLLTAQNSSDDKILGLDAGADDYVVKPFELLELLARIRVLLRRGSLPQITVLEWGNLRLDPGVRIATYNGQALTLTPKEYRLLELFLRNPQRVFSRNDILNHLWSSEASPGEDTVTVHIKDLRRKLKQASAPSDVIETVYGHGYRLKVEATKAPAEKDLIRQKTQAGLAVVWQKYLGLSRDRLSILEQASLKLLDNTLMDQQRQQAQQAAHKLAGALGVFGMIRASHLAREIELIFQQETCDRTQAADVIGWIAALSYELNRSEKDKPIPPDRPLLLVADDDKFIQKVLSLAKHRGMGVALASSLAIAQNIISVGQGLVLLRFSLRSATEDDLVSLVELTHQIPPIPILFLTDEDRAVHRLQAARLATSTFLSPAVSPEQVLAIVQLSRAIAEGTKHSVDSISK
jgi:DNA-binding response OmpR family regulator